MADVEWRLARTRMARALKGMHDERLYDPKVRRLAYEVSGALHGVNEQDYQGLDDEAVFAEKLRQSILSAIQQPSADAGGTAVSADKQTVG